MPQVTLQQALDLAAQLQKNGKPADAETIYRQILAQQPNHAPSFENLAHLTYLKGDMAGAEELLRRAIALNPSNASVYANLGMLMAMSGRLEDAVAAFRQGIAIRPALAETHNNLGNALRELGRLQEATAEYNLALSLNPTFPEARWNMGLMLLMHGDFERGWPLYESRRDIATFNFQANLHGREWQGFEKFTQSGFVNPTAGVCDLTGRTILLQSEQGFGDTIQFVRYVPLVARSAGRVILRCQPPLVRLLRCALPGVEVIAQTDPVPPFDMSAPLLSLPRLFGTRMENIPARVPYLSAPPDLATKWRERIKKDGAQIIGLTWSGRCGNAAEQSRAIPIEQLAMLLREVPGLQFVSLQKHEPGASRTLPPREIIDFSDQLLDFADTAALIANLDAVISIDTAVAHLAGAMGKRVWTLLRHVPDWRWLLNRTDSPWYPTMRLFRQPVRGDWLSVIGNVCEALRSESNHAPS